MKSGRMKRILLSVIAFLFVGCSIAGGTVLLSNTYISESNRGGDSTSSENELTKNAPTNSDLWTNGHYATAFDNEGEAGIDGTTEEKAYEIRTAEQLALLAYRINTSTTNSTYRSLYYVQTADIDLSLYYWDAIGYSSSYNFSGCYDGGGFVISGLYTKAGTTSAYNYQGLFGWIYNRGSDYVSVHDLTLKESNIQGYAYVGAIAGYIGIHSNQYGVYIYNCKSYATISGDSNVGGLIGLLTNSSATIKNCHNYGDVTALDTYGYVGGIIGYSGNSNTLSLSNSSNHGIIQGINYVGGIAGDLDGTMGEIYNCHNTGEIISQGSYAGGIVGGESASYGKNNIYNCYNEGKISSSTGYVGGIAGRGCEIYYCYNLGLIISSGNYSGGIAGVGTNIFSSYNKGNINGTDYVGGVSGNATINCCYNTASVNGESYVGGVSGIGSIYNSFNLGEISGVDSSTTGAIGNSGEVYNSYWEENLLIGNAVGTNFSAINCGRCSILDIMNIDWYSGSRWHSNYAWDFINAWDFRAEENDNLPVLKSFYGTTRTNVYWTDYGNYADSFDGGNGTESSPYLIRTPEQLALLAYLINNASTNPLYRYSYFSQIADIDLSSSIWVPIGIYNHISYVAFSGAYDGNGHKITGLNFIEEISCNGLFGYTKSMDLMTPTIHDLIIENSTNNVTSRFTGYLVGCTNGVINIYNCYNYANINVNNNYACLGGLIGYAVNGSCNIENCANFGIVYATTSTVAGVHGVGGIVGYAGESVNLDDCYNAGEVTNYSSSSSAWRVYAGGVIGVADSGEITGCFNSGSVVGRFSGLNVNMSGVGGVAGISGDTNISNCHNEGSVLSGTAVGGVVGNGDATYCYNEGSVTGSGSSVSVGGVVGSGIGRYCYNKGSVSSTSSAYVGGVVGGGTATYCFNTSSLSAPSHLGGIIGSGTAQYCYNIGDVTSSGSYIYVGGLCASGRAYNCYNLGDVTGRSSYSGGISGYIGSGQIYNCYNLGDVTGWYVGGIAGQCASSSIYNCINMGDLSATSREGGIVGGLYGTSSYRSDRYYWSISSGSIYNCFWGENVNFSIATSSDLNRKAYGEADTYVYTDAGNEVYAPSAWSSQYNGICAIEEAKDITWYIDSTNWHSSYAWDFDNVWAFVEGMNDGYPVLSTSFLSVTYQANDGSDRVFTDQVSGWQNYKIKGNDIFERNGYIIDNWNTVADGSGVSYAPGATYTGSSVTLYAQWEAMVITVNLDVNGGSGGTSAIYLKYDSGWYSSSSCTSSSKITALPSTPTRTGYDFKGYSTEPDGSGTLAVSETGAINVSDTFYSTDGTRTWYAVWEARNPAYYDSEGGFWYVENGKLPQSKVSDSLKSTLEGQWSSLTDGSVYYMGVEELADGDLTTDGGMQSKVYNGEEYVKFNGEFYLVEPIRWRLTYSDEQDEGYAVENTSVLATMAEIVFLGSYSSAKIGMSAGYSAESVTMFLKNQVSTEFLVSESREVEIFGAPKDTTTVSGSVFVASMEELANFTTSKNNTTGSGVKAGKVSLSDFVKDYLRATGQGYYYFTRDLGDQLNTIRCLNPVGDRSQAKAQQTLGVQFTVKVKEYACKSV